MFQFINIKILTEQATPKCTLFLSLHYVPRNKFKQTWALFMCCWVLFLSCFINALKSDKIWRFSITLTALNVPEVSRSGPTLPLTCIWSDFNLIYGKAMAPHSSTLAWKIPWVEEPGRLQFMGLRRVRHNWGLHFHFSLSCIGEGNGNPLQCSCLENPRDREARWAAVYGVAQSRTRLKWLSSNLI